MTYRKFKPDKIFDGYQFLDEGQVLITDEQGRVISIANEEQAGDDIQLIEGIISPGFVNSHCHIELSHMKAAIPPRMGLVNFLCSVIGKRNLEPGLINTAMAAAETEMLNNGIVAVGDISNSVDSIQLKSNSRLRWHNFIEVLNLADANTDARMLYYKGVLSAFLEALNDPDHSNLTPHSPYSISPATFQRLNEETAARIVSIHNQESAAENELYEQGTGDFLRFYSLLGLTASPLPVTGKTSLQSVLPYFNKKQTLILVHDVHTTEQDIDVALTYSRAHQLTLYFCVCPNANRYIENSRPPVPMLLAKGCQLLLGTDSYSSNWQLSIAAEMSAIQQSYPNIPLEEIFRWATSNGAEAFRWQHQLGSFAAGKTPGVVRVAADLSFSERLL